MGGLRRGEGSQESGHQDSYPEAVRSLDGRPVSSVLTLVPPLEVCKRRATRPGVWQGGRLQQLFLRGPPCLVQE